MNREDDPELWDLLEQAKKVEPSPFFARNVLRAVRSHPSRPVSGFSGWRFGRIATLLSTAAAIVVTAVAVETFHKRAASPRNSNVVLAEGQDPDLAADLDVLASADDDSDDSALL